MTFWDGLQTLSTQQTILLVVALLIAFGFEVINGFHDTANAVTTVIYSRTLKPTPAVLYSGFMNFLGVLLGGTAVAFSIVNLLPVDLLVDATSTSAMIMTLSLLASGVVWNLSTWAMGLPVSSSHTLIGSILGVGLAHGWLMGAGFGSGVDWHKAGEVGLSLLISPVIGFVAAAGLLLLLKRTVREPRLYVPPEADDKPPRWIKGVLVLTCGGVSFAHGSNDGQKGMGLILLVLVGLMPAYYGLNLGDPDGAAEVHLAAYKIGSTLKDQLARDEAMLARVTDELAGLTSLAEVPPEKRWALRTAIFRLEAELRSLPEETLAPVRGEVRQLGESIEYVPFWVVLGVALCLGIGTTIGYKRIVITVAEKIGKTHLTYGQGAAAETVAMGTIGLASLTGMPVSTTHVLASGVAGTMWANRSGLQPATLKKILLAWILTLPASMALAALLFTLGTWLFTGI